MRPRPFVQVAQWVGNRPAVELFTTAITEAEVFYGIELLPKSRRRDGLLAAAEAMFGKDFAERVLAFDSDAARAFSRIAARRRALGKPISHADAQIAAIVQLNKATLATRNVADFAHCEIRLIDPWNEPI
jgi:predicted nucleic acid-binding protein